MLQSVQLPFALLPVLHLTSSRKYMGQFANGLLLKVICWSLSIIVVATNIYLVGTSLTGVSIAVLVIVGVVAVAYFTFIFAIIRSDIAELCASELCGGMGDTSDSDDDNANPARTNKGR